MLVNALNVYVREASDRLIKMESSNLRTMLITWRNRRQELFLIKGGQSSETSLRFVNIVHGTPNDDDDPMSGRNYGERCAWETTRILHKHVYAFAM